MCKEELNNIVNDVYTVFAVELAICEVFKRRWSYVTGTKNFIGGKHRFIINNKYGIIINCEDKDLERIRNFVEQRKE